ncbi:DNA-3-methyladenine glycosylase family protein [Intestinimonas massiliensis (ex Afouda et al. 2020)]|uniref:DNA-3-methyladenine glycosylase family protein n=1 Tax=Intestinimonas massiliensis (ex Afouda et al. 2020) TaxID=1673721 RepID=UPI001032240A|nr:DNA glycosylase [Intestinimonas massiliensis (ex Afouda et al. 2020)]
MEVYIPDLFDLNKIISSGQCFRAVARPDGTCRFVTGEQVLYIRKVSEENYEVSCGRDAWASVWSPYFDLGRDYRTISAQIPRKDSFLSRAAQAGAGIRILRQDPWETLVTFIISQRKSIPAIRWVVEMLSQRYGTPIRTSEETLYAFPTARQLENVCEADYITCKAGYRAPYLCDAVRQVLSGCLDLSGISALSDCELIEALKGVRGVGVKVANCVALFAYGRTACAPVDTWIKKIIQREYRGRDPFGRYGPVAGIMQQYFFYYAQSHKGEPAHKKKEPETA